MASVTQAELYIDDRPAVDGTLSTEVEQIDVTMSVKTEPDKSWEYIDPLGHYHAWTEDGKLPTLKARSQHVECADPDCDCGMEGYDVTVYDCAICGAPVEPKTVSHSPSGREYAPGRMTWSVEAQGQYETGAIVSVRLVAGDFVTFGVAQVTPVASWSSDQPVRTTLVGIGELGRRKRTKVAT